MAANNLKAIGIQLIVIVLFFVLLSISNDTATLLFSLSTVFIYFLAGFVLLNPTVKSPAVSVSWLFVILFINAVASFIIILTNATDAYETFIIYVPTESIFANPVNWFIVELAQALHIPLDLANKLIHGLAILTSALPSLLMYFGMVAKKNAQKATRTA